MTIALWVFPASDFADWCDFVGDPQVTTYSEYLTLIASVQADQERQGYTVRRVTLTVAEMRQLLEHYGLPNTPDGRASALAKK